MQYGATLDLRFDVTTEEFVRFLADLGLTHVEIRQGYRNTHPEAPSPRRLRELGEEYDVTWTVHAPHIDLNPGNLDEAMRRATSERIRETIDVAVAAGAGAVVVHAGSSRRRYPDRVQERAREQSVETLRECALHADEVGMPLAVENQRDKPGSRRHSATPERLLGLLDDIDVDSDYLGVTLDVGHAKATGVDYQAFVDLLGDRITVLHLHDNDGESDAHEPLPTFRSVAENVNATYNVLEMKSLEDIRRCVDASK